MERTRNIVKVSANLPADVVATLRDLAERQGITMTEVLRRAISTEKFIEDTRASGSRILIQDREEKVRELVYR